YRLGREGAGLISEDCQRTLDALATEQWDNHQRTPIEVVKIGHFGWGEIRQSSEIGHLNDVAAPYRVADAGHDLEHTACRTDLLHPVQRLAFACFVRTGTHAQRE